MLDEIGLAPGSHDALGHRFARRCFAVGDNRILLCEQPREVPYCPSAHVHHSFTVTAETLTKACKVFVEQGVNAVKLVYRPKGIFTGRELYFHDPSGNRLKRWTPLCIEDSLCLLSNSLGLYSNYLPRRALRS